MKVDYNKTKKRGKYKSAFTSYNYKERLSSKCFLYIASASFLKLQIG